MTSHKLARRLFELPDVPVDVESIAVVLRRPGGDTRVVTDRAFLEKQEDEGHPNEEDGAESILLDPYPSAR